MKTTIITSILGAFAIAASLLTAWNAGAQADAQRLLPFQGRLTDQAGAPVSNGVKIVQFKMFESAAGGAPVWGGEVHRTTVNGGLVNVLLGTKTPLPQTNALGEFFFNKQLYLEITVDVSGPGGGGPDGLITSADPPMLPRQAILPVIFAKDAARSVDSKYLAGRDWSSILVPGAAGNDPAFGKILGAKIQDGGVNTTQIANGAITTAKLGTGAAAANIGTGALTGTQIQDGSITGTDVQDGSITGADIADRSITGVDIAGNSITETEIADSLGGFSYLGSQTIVAANRLAIASPFSTYPFELFGRARIMGNGGQTAGTWYLAPSSETVSFIGLLNEDRAGIWMGTELSGSWRLSVDKTDGKVRASAGFITGPTDLAENFGTLDATLGPGDVVCANPNSAEGIAKARTPYDNTLMGVLSDKPGFLLGEKEGVTNACSPLALTGRVPTKVCLEAGAIRIGDYLTSSSIPGVAMKATQEGQVIGMAMENYGTDDKMNRTQIIVFINPQWRGAPKK